MWHILFSKNKLCKQNKQYGNFSATGAWMLVAFDYIESWHALCASMEEVTSHLSFDLFLSIAFDHLHRDKLGVELALS
jgi:hypothetical protein